MSPYLVLFRLPSTVVYNFAGSLKPGSLAYPDFLGTKTKSTAPCGFYCTIFTFSNSNKKEHFLLSPFIDIVVFIVKKTFGIAWKRTSQFHHHKRLVKPYATAISFMFLIDRSLLLRKNSDRKSNKNTKDYNAEKWNRGCRLQFL